ncbi:MAG: AMP-binding protein [Burkholderiaceae bacterium]
MIARDPPPSSSSSSRQPSLPSSFDGRDAPDALPLLGHRSTQSVFAWRAGRPITVAQFLADVERLAGLLPDAAHLVNGCTDSYDFAVGLVAAMRRGQISVLPHNAVRRTLLDLADDYPGATMLRDAVTTATGAADPMGAGAGAGAGDDAAVESPLPALRCPAGHAPIGSQTIPSFDADLLVAILFTSGSTGRPQALPRRWGTIALSALAEARRLELDPDRPFAVLATGPAQHSYGFESAIWLPMLAGGQIVAEHPFYPADVFDQLARLPMPRLLVTSPVPLRAMMGSSLTPPPATIVMSATAPLPVDLAHAAERQFGATLVEIYGSTETGQVASRCTTRTDVWQTLPGVCFTQQDGTTLAGGGHVGAPVALSDRIALIDAEHFRLLGRHADLIKVAGKRGSLRAVEQHLLDLPGVRDAAVLAGDEGDGSGGDGAVARLTGFVVAPTLSAAQITRQLRERLDPAFIPRPLIFVDALPRDGNGKLPRQRLVELARQWADARRKPGR